MNQVSAWVQDRKNMPIMVGGLFIVALLVLIILKVTGVIGGSAQPAATQADSGGTAQTASPSGAAMNPMMNPMMGGMSPMGGPSTGGAQGEEVAAAPAEKEEPILPYKSDPFYVAPKSSAKADDLSRKMQGMVLPRLAPFPVDKPATENVAQAAVAQPKRRLAGVVWNGKVSAILETNGEMDVVKPGQELGRGNARVRVESIQPTYVVLKTLDSKNPSYIRVNLAGSPNAAQNSGGAPMVGGMPGMPGMPGMGMPGMPMPGMPMPGMPMPGGMPAMPGGAPIE